MVATAAPPRLASSYALGRRVEKVVTGATYRYIYSGVETVSVYTSTGTWKQDYVYGSGIDEVLVLEQADVLDWDGDSNTSEVARSWYRANALGSILRVEEPDRTEAVSYRYAPYGEVTITRGGASQSGDPLGQHVTYTGRWRDEETGLYHYRARAYEPVRGRFMQRDPIGYEDGPSRYVYAGASPIGRRDPTGRSWLGEVVRVVAEASGVPPAAADKMKDAVDNATPAQVAGAVAAAASGGLVGGAVEAAVAQVEASDPTVDALPPTESGEDGVHVVEVDVNSPYAPSAAVTIPTPFGPLIIYHGIPRRARHSSGRCTFQAHERGHAMQYWWLGGPFGILNYMFGIGLPSIIRYHGSGGEHHDHPVERDATERGERAYGTDGPR